MEDFLSVNGMTQEEAQILIDINTDHYLGKWDKHLHSSFKGWNWAAFFIAPFWLVYRKMYWTAILYWAILFAVDGLISVFFQVLGDSSVEITIQTHSLLAAVFFGLFGNALYQKKVLRTFQKTKEQTKRAPVAYMERWGGVNESTYGIYLIAGFLIGAIQFVLTKLFS